MATLGRPPVAIDVLTSSKGLTFAEAWRGRTTLQIEGGERVGFLGLAEYVKTKLACGRPKDLLDIELLREAGMLEALSAHKALPTKAKQRSTRKSASKIKGDAARSGKPESKRRAKKRPRPLGKVSGRGGSPDHLSAV